MVADSNPGTNRMILLALFAVSAGLSPMAHPLQNTPMKMRLLISLLISTVVAWRIAWG
jgi:hypothetical protein